MAIFSPIRDLKAESRSFLSILRVSTYVTLVYMAGSFLLGQAGLSASELRSYEFNNLLQKDIYYVYTFFVSSIYTYHYTRTRSPIRLFLCSFLGLILAFCLDGFVYFCRGYSPRYVCFELTTTFAFYLRSYIRGFCDAAIWLSTLIYVESCASYHTKGKFVGILFAISNCSRYLTNFIHSLGLVYKAGHISAYVDVNALLATFSLIGLTAFFTIKFRPRRRISYDQDDYVPDKISSIKIFFTTPFDKNNFVTFFLGWAVGYIYMTNTYIFDNGNVFSTDINSIARTHNEQWIMNVSRDVVAILGSVIIGAIADSYKNNTNLLVSIVKLYLFAHIPLALAVSFENFYLLLIANIVMNFAYTGMAVVAVAKVCENFTEKIQLLAAYQASMMSMKMFIANEIGFQHSQMAFISQAATVIAFTYFVYENAMAVYNTLFKSKNANAGQRAPNLGEEYDIY